jgi:hypothetical protein
MQVDDKQVDCLSSRAHEPSSKIPHNVITAGFPDPSQKCHCRLGWISLQGFPALETMFASQLSFIVHINFAERGWMWKKVVGFI